MLRNLHIILIAFCLNIGAAFAVDVEPMNVLFIGNSYTHTNNMPELFGKIATSKGIKVNVEMSAVSSYSFRLHSERVEMYDAIRSKKWDYIVLQGFSRELSYSPKHIDTASIPYLNRILDSIYTNNSCTNVLLYMTWGYKDGWAEREEINTFTKMADSIRKGCQYVSDIYSLPIVPVGAVWREIATKSDINLYTADGQHPTIYGSYLIACTFYAAIFKSSPVDTFLSNRIDEKSGRLIQETAYKYVTAHVDSCRLNQNTLKIKAERTKMGTFFVHCSANYPYASSIMWLFDDGTGSEKSKVTHQYTSPGTYWITLIVSDDCGIRTIKRKVVFENPKKPVKRDNSKPKVILNAGNKVY